MSIISEAIRTVRPDLSASTHFPPADTRGLAPSQLAYLEGSTIQETLTPEAVLAAGRWERDLEALDQVLPLGLIAEREREQRVHAERMTRRVSWIVAGLIGATLLGICVGALGTRDVVHAEMRPAAPVSQTAATQAYAELISQQAPPVVDAAAAAPTATEAGAASAPAPTATAGAVVVATAAPAPPPMVAARTYAALAPVRKGEAGSFAPQPSVGGYAEQPLVAPDEVLVDGLSYAHGDAGVSEELEIESPDAGDGEVLFEAAPVPAAGSRGKSSRKSGGSIETANVDSGSDDDGALRVEGIFWDKERPLALIADKIVEVGAKVKGCEVVSIEPGAVTLREHGALKVLRP